ncbi:hypothetical protein [Thermostichus vulcanus]|uniref:Leucyl aminopeptidase n=1 Tax=Thermostichus vulcanus str. 'Rupite' TaxID=2813851 RepID=A0ABT0CBZ7_THEVL|nr:hypothetical protein [Thermostichus vulcanus]MCJ2543317.1 hypothetical protein [Thermostichus vulcanus str. 'Rupite']
MKLSLMTESRSEYYAFELAAAARRLAEEVLEIQPGQEVLITADTLSDARVVQATAQACFAAGGIPVVMTYPTAAKPQSEPPASVAAALASADIWIEYSHAYIMYTHAWQRAVAAGVQYCAFGDMDVDGLVRCFGRVKVPLLETFGDCLIDLLTNSRDFHLTTELGTDLHFSNEGVPIGAFRMKANPKHIPIMLAGQVSWSPVAQTMQGRFVADGILYPPEEVGILTDRVILTVEAGTITQIEGGREAQLLQKWIDKLADPTLYKIAHTSYGFNPGIMQPTGRITEDERAFGCFNCGWGAWVDRPAAGHFDVTALQVSSWVDGIPLAKNGLFVHPDLAALCREMGVPGH